MHLQLAKVRVHELLAGAEALVFPQLLSKSLQYQYRPCEATLTVRADRVRLQQIILNLLTNAIKFTDTGGAITLSVETGSDNVLIRVADSGRGIPAERLADIFEPFVRVDSGFTRPTEGAGLGLTISRSLSRAMGGDITVESALGVGSVFTLRLCR